MNRRGFIGGLTAAYSFNWLRVTDCGYSHDRVSPGTQADPCAADAHPYSPVPGWPKIPADLRLGAVSSVAVAPSGQIYVLHRGARPLLCFDREGNLLRSWGDGHIKVGHGLRIDPQGFVWATDVGHHQVFKFTAEGRLVFALGKEDQSGDALGLFNQPTDVAVLPSGEFFVSDGYGNSRIIKFSPDGKPVRTWGQKGRNPGEFDTPHALCLNSKARLFVSDRGNTRLQVFSSEGEFLDEWRDYPALDGMCCGPDDTLFVATGRGNEILRLKTSEVVLESWGGPRSTEAEVQGGAVPPPGRFNVAHGISIDRNGELYVAEVRARRVQKLVRRQGCSDHASCE